MDIFQRFVQHQFKLPEYISCKFSAQIVQRKLRVSNRSQPYQTPGFRHSIHFFSKKMENKNSVIWQFFLEIKKKLFLPVWFISIHAHQTNIGNHEKHSYSIGEIELKKWKRKRLKWYQIKMKKKSFFFAAKNIKTENWFRWKLNIHYIYVYLKEKRNAPKFH